MRDYSITKKKGEWYNAKVTDLEAGKVDSSVAETYISNLDGVIIDLGVTR